MRTVMSLKIKYAGQSILFKKIMDGNYTRAERAVLLLMSRKSIHFDSLMFAISMQDFKEAVEIGMPALRKAISAVEAKEVLRVRRSTNTPSSFGFCHCLLEV